MPGLRRTKRLIATLACAAGVLSPSAVYAQERPEWRSLAPMLTPRTEAAAAVLDGEIYVMGGYAPPAESVPIVEIYNPEQDTWRPGPPLPLPVNHAMAVTFHGEIYLFGGYVGYALGSQFSVISVPTDRTFVLRDGTWAEISPLPEARAAGGAAVVDGRILIVGGVGEDGANATDSLVYEPVRDSWATRPGLEFPRQHLGVTSARGRAYAIGGRYDLLNSNMSVVERLDSPTARWTTLAPMPTPRGGLGTAATRNGWVVAVGGEGPEATYPEAEAFSLKRRRWFSFPPMLTPRHGLGVVAIGNVVYAIGGGTEPSYSYSGANEAIDLSTARLAN